MGNRNWSQVEQDELLAIFPLRRHITPFGTKLSKFSKKWNRSEKAVKAYWNKAHHHQVDTVATQVEPPTNLTLDNLTNSLKIIRDYLVNSVEELNKLIGD
jgi:hypothetical protein